MKKKLLFLVVILMVSLLVGCGKKEEKISIVGSWDYSGFVFVFNDDKTGSYIVGDTEMNFSYELDEEKVIVTFDGNSTGSEYKYKVEDNKLYLTDNFGKEIEYIKK